MDVKNCKEITFATRKALFHCRLIKVQVKKADVKSKALLFRNQNITQCFHGTTTNMPKV